MKITLSKCNKLELPEPLESWQYCNPVEICDRLKKKTEAEIQQEREAEDRHRRHKSRRIRALVRKAKGGR